MIMNIMFNMVLEFAFFLLVGQNFKDFDLLRKLNHFVILSAAKYLCLSTAQETLILTTFDDLKTTTLSY